MKERAIWFVLGAAFASVFWLAFMGGLGQEWLDLLLTPGR
jgi:arginine exporter protein ArgO